MSLEFWMPQRQQLNDMAEAWMAGRMGEDWRGIWNPSGQDCGVRAVLKWGESRCCFFMTSSFQPRKTQTLTEQLYQDGYGTALLDCGRELLREYAEKRLQTVESVGDTIKSQIVNKRCKLCAPGLNGLSLEKMKTLYQEVGGWLIGISVNDFGVLIPEKSFGGWYEWETVDNTTAGNDATAAADEMTGAAAMAAAESTCRPGAGCLFCQRQDKQCDKQKPCGKEERKWT